MSARWMTIWCDSWFFGWEWLVGGCVCTKVDSVRQRRIVGSELSVNLGRSKERKDERRKRCCPFVGCLSSCCCCCCRFFDRGLEIVRQDKERVSRRQKKVCVGVLFLFLMWVLVVVVSSCRCVWELFSFFLSSSCRFVVGR